MFEMIGKEMAFVNDINSLATVDREDDSTIGHRRSQVKIIYLSLNENSFHLRCIDDICNHLCTDCCLHVLIEYSAAQRSDICQSTTGRCCIESG